MTLHDIGQGDQLFHDINMDSDNMDDNNYFADSLCTQGVSSNMVTVVSLLLSQHLIYLHNMLYVELFYRSKHKTHPPKKNIHQWSSLR